MPDDQELLDLAASLRDDVQPTKADQVRGQLKAAETYNPDAYAKAMKAGAKKGVKPQVVLQDPKAFEDRPNAEELVVLSPKTADWILENFDNAVVGGDDVKNLSRLEDLPRLVAAPPPTFTDRVRGLFRSAMEGTLFSSEQEAQAIRQAESARQQTERRFGLKPGEFHTGAVTALPTARIAAGFARGAISPMAGLASFAERKTGIDLGLGRVGKSLVGALTPQAPTLADVATENVASTLGLLIPSMGFSKAVQLITKIPALAKYLRAAKILGDWAGPVAMALPEAAAEAESAYDQSIAQGMEPAKASRRADGVFMSNLVLLAATDKITWFGKGPQWRKSLSEAIQEGGQQVTGNIATDRPVLEGTAEAAGTGAAIATAIPVLGKFLGQLVTTRGMRYATPLEMAQKEIIQNLADTAKDSKLLQRSPEDFAKAAQAIAPVENLRIQPDAFVTYFQSKNIDPVKMAETLGIQNFEEASVSGTDLLIPTGAYAAHLAASEHHAELSQDLRLSDDMMTPREAAAAEATKGQVEEVGQAVSLEVDEATQAGEDFQSIQEDLKARYIQAGETPAVADTYALDMAKVFYTLAQREGLNPQELMAQYAPKIVRGQAPMPEQVVAEAFTPETFPEEGVQWWEKDDLWFQGAYGEKPQKVETAPGVVQAPFRQTEFQGQLEDYQKTGQWYYNERRMVPLAAIEEKAPWDEGRRVDAETRLKDTAATTPVLLATEDGGKTFKIQDGIHRIAAAKAQGFTAIPAEVQVVVSDRAPTEGDFAGKDRLEAEPQFKGVDVESPEFKAWFGDSKVVDAEGKPLKVYHGTTVDEAFGEFKEKDFKEPSKQFLLDIGIHFSGSTDTASLYANPNKRRGDIGSGKSGVTPKVYPVYINIKNPLDLTSGIDSKVKEKLFREHSKFFKGGKSKVLFDVDPILLIQDLQRKMGRETIQTFIKGMGFDGVIYNWNQSDNYLVFEPTQIKSAISNTGAFSRTDPRILYQAAKPGPRLTTLHNLSAENLMNADRMGGLAVPSIAVVPEGQGMEGFGEITLIGGKNLADPERNPVFSGDAFSPRWPKAEYKKPKMAPVDAWSKSLRPDAELFDDRANHSEIWDNIVNQADAQRAIDQFQRSNYGKAAFLKTKGKAVDPVTKPAKIDAIFLDSPAWNEFQKTKGWDSNYDVNDEAYIQAASDAISKGIDQYVATLGMEPNDARWFASLNKKTWLGDEGKLSAGKASKLSRDIEAKDIPVVDKYATEDALNAALSGLESEFKTWTESQILALFDAPYLTIGKKKVPYTLENIVEVMKGEVKNREKTLTFGEGAAKAAISKQFKTLEEMRVEAAQTIRPKEDVDAANAKSEAATNAYRDAVSEFTTIMDWKGNPDIWEAMNGSMRALVRMIKKGKPTNATIRAALKAEDFNTEAMPEKVFDLAREAVEAFKAAPVEYFEAKPQRAVSLDEFTGAVVPADTPQAVLDVLAKHGIQVQTYVGSGEQAKASAELTRRLEGRGTLFQSQKDDFSFGSKAWNEYYRSQVGSRARAKGDQAARAKKALEAAGTKRGQAEFDAEREAALRAEEEAFMRFDRAVEQIAKPRGWFTRAADGTFIIGKTPQGDFSTFIHEPAHAYLEMFKDLATREGASQRIQDDGAKVLAFLGVESWDQIGTIEHEKWARANEAYCREGKAPSDTLRGVFERFRVWLSMVYRQVAALEVELNDDIRGVFDRMRATDEEIELAHAEIAGPRLFRTAEEAGMTEKDFQRYAREKDLEVEQAKGEILAKLNAAAVREKTREWKEEAANVRAAIEQWVDAQPNFRAVAVLRAGKLEDGTAFTLKRDALIEQFGEERTKALLKAHPGIYRLEGELDAETAAEILGFESGEALMAALEETPKRGEVIKSEVQRVMTERHGDIRYDGTLEDQALQAVANDQRAKGLHKELEALKRKLENAPAQTKIQSLKDQIAKLEAEAKAQVKEKDDDAAFLAKQANALAETNEQLRARLEARDAKIQALKDQLAQAEAERKQETREDSAKRRAVRELPPIQSFRDEAKRLVDGKAIKDLQPQTYINAMRTYGRKAWVADKKQDYQGAYDAKLKEILNQFLYLDAKKTLAESEKAFKYVKDLQKPSNVQAIAKAGGEEGQHVYWDQIQNILNEYQFIKVPNRNLRDTALFAAEHEQFGITFDVTQLPGAKNYRELTMPQITAVVDALKNIEHVAKNLGKVYQKLKKVDLEIEVTEASDSAYASHTGKLKPIPSMGEYQTWIQKLPRTVATWRAKMGKLDWWVDYLDGGNINGAWRRNTFGMINPAAARKNQVGKLVHQKMRELYSAMPKNFRDNLWRDTGIQFPNRERPLNEGQLICWFLNLGTEENRLKATLGEGLMDGMGVMNPVYDQALAGLTLHQCKFVQGLWDTLGIMLPDIKAKHLRETGLELKLKKVTPFKVKTKDGKEFFFQGGYWPLKADPWLSQVGELQEMMGIPTLGTIARPTTNKSHTKAVTNATYALNLDIGANLTQHIDDVLTDTYCAEAMNDVFKFLRQPRIKKSIQQTMGAEYYQEFLSWLLDFSNSNKTVDQGDAFLLKPLLRFKSAFVVSKLALNFSSNAMQLLDPIKVLLDKDMKVLSYAKGFASVMLNRKLFAEVQELSPNVMRFRAENWNRELHELANYRGKFNSKLAAFQQAAMITFTLMDKLNTTTAWYGRYIQGLEETNGDVDQAIELADRIVDRSFQAGAPHHMSRLMRTKGWTNLFTTFGGDISTWFGIMDNAIRTGDPKRMVVVLMGLFIEQILAQIIRNRMPTEDEDEIEWLLLQAGHSVFGKIPFIGDMVEIGMAKLEDRVPQFGNPVFDAGEKALMSPFRAYDAYTKQEDAEKASMEIVDALGTTLGIPGTAQWLKSWRYFKDVREGRRPEPEGPVQATYEAILPPKKER